MGQNTKYDSSQTQFVERDDIFLLLESYKNNIELTTTLLEHQKQILEKEIEIIRNQSEMLKSQGDIVKKIEFSQSEIEDILTKLSEKQVNLQIDSSKDHGKLYTLIYVCLGGMASIVLGLIGLLVMFADKFNLLKNIAMKVGAQLF